MVNLSGLGVGWMTKCEYCQKEFRTFSTKQRWCCDECSFLGRRKLNEKNGCIEWTGNINNGGYGVMRIHPSNKMYSAHRYAWEYVNGAIAKGLCVCHKCDNPKCTNPDHLFLGTHYDNNHDRSLKKRSGKRTFSEEELKHYSLLNRGEKNNAAKLTEQQVKEIYKLKHLVKKKDLAARFGVSEGQIKCIWSKKRWKYLTADM